MEDSQLETQTLDEDPTAFLVRMKSLCPGILSVLGPKQAKLLSVNPTDPYDPKNVDEEYLSDAGGMYGLKYQHTTGENALRISLLRPKVTTKPLNVEEFTVTKATVKMVSAVVSQASSIPLIRSTGYIIWCCESEGGAGLRG